jgi:hypothetical protein
MVGVSSHGNCGKISLEILCQHLRASSQLIQALNRNFSKNLSFMTESIFILVCMSNIQVKWLSSGALKSRYASLNSGPKGPTSTRHRELKLARTRMLFVMLERVDNISIIRIYWQSEIP